MKSSYREEFEEIDERYREPKKDKKKGKKKKAKNLPKPGGLNGVLQSFNEKQTKGNVQNTLLKTIADLAGVGLGTAVSAAAGKAAPLLGIAMIGAGHYVGDESGLLRVVGAATVAHSVAKSKEYSQDGLTMKDRLSGLKDDWLRLAIAKHEGQKNTVVAAPVPAPPAQVVNADPVPEPKPTPAPIPTVQPTAERRKTPYELEIEQRQRELEEEAEQMREEMEQADREREEKKQAEADTQEIDMSELNELEQSLRGAAEQHLQTGDFTYFDPDTFDDDEFRDLAPHDEEENEPPHRGPGSGRTRQLWPSESPNIHEDFLDDEDYNFDNY